MISSLLILLQIFVNSDKVFESQLKNYLDEKFASYVKYEYQISELPKNYFKIELDYDREFRLNKNYAFVPVKIYDRKNRASLSIVTLKIKLYQYVLVALKDISRNELLSENQFTKKLIDVTNIRGKIVQRIDFSEVFRSKAIIKNGSVLIEELIEPVPDVFYNEKLILHAGRNGVDISTEVTAKEEGRIGDVIRVVTSDNKLFKAKIIDKYNVSLIE
ncbi:MAG: flagellar basal body P-ring formation chaperone FlgA [Melioribacter sp.]|uniref:flagellar basal body P-ring formation chaperone FlgA n=1 Tax=Rosettibacter primus TaxID=3111523 RepID=UPI00247E85E7|nr:flagellar basal body P-ring formation chaperone FlgA [Melioribacter sp.]